MPKTRKSLLRRDSIKPLEPLTINCLLDGLRRTAKEFSEACNVPEQFTSKSWWVTAIGRLLGDQGLRVSTDVSRGDWDLGLFYYAITPDFEKTIDVLGCPEWSRNKITVEDEYGQDEPFLPPFHVVRVLTDQSELMSGKISDAWDTFLNIGDSIKGPVTASLVCINHFSAEGRFRSAETFRKEMEKLGVVHEVSTQIMKPGILSSVTVFERFEPFQVLTANKVWARPALQNRAHKP